MKTYGGVGSIGPVKWSASRPGCLTSEERVPGIHRIGVWVDLRGGLDAMPGVEPSCTARRYTVQVDGAWKSAAKGFVDCIDVDRY
jgi:hypothetical protein